MRRGGHPEAWAAGAEAEGEGLHHSLSAPQPGGPAPSPPEGPRILHLQRSVSNTSTATAGGGMEMRHERRRTAARLLALVPDFATDLTQLRSRFVRRERAKEAAEKFRGGSGTNAQPLPTQSLLSNLGRARKSPS